MNKNKSPINLEEANLYIELIKNGLSADLLDGRYKDRPIGSHATYGLCSVASEALYFMLGGLNADIISYVVKDIDGTTHWWLQDSKGVILDPTVEQYTSIGRLPPYSRGIQGKPCGFMGMRVDVGNEYGFDRKPSKRASLLLSNILNNSVDNKIKLCLK